MPKPPRYEGVLPVSTFNTPNSAEGSVFTFGASLDFRRVLSGKLSFRLTFSHDLIVSKPMLFT